MSGNRTTELRKLLDEHGVKYVIGYDQKGTSAVETTYFKHDGKSAELMVWGDTDHTKLTAYDLTPEQVIAVTLGGGECELVELNSRAERTCECIVEYAKSPLDGKTIVLHRCSSCNELMRPHMNYCPNCGAKVKDVTNDN